MNYEGEDLAVIIGRNVRALRERSNLSQENIAHYLNLKQTMISMCENGERKFSLISLEKLADLFGCNTDSFISNDLPKETLNYAFRADAIEEEDLKAVATINKIALNLIEMQRLWKDGAEFTKD